MTPADYLAPHLPPRLVPAGTATAYAPANIALAKYWGKRDRVLNLPVNGSLSISLGSHGSRTTVGAAEADSITLNGVRAAADSALHRRTFAFIEHLRRGAPQPLAITSENTIPTAAGLASSASGFAALTLALNAYWRLNLPGAVLSALARIGSGSAARSLWHGFVKWDKGEQPDGRDIIATPIASDWQDLRVALLPNDTPPPPARFTPPGRRPPRATSPRLRRRFMPAISPRSARRRKPTRSPCTPPCSPPAPP